MSVIIVENKDKVIAKLSEIIEETARISIQKRGKFLVGFSGGSLATFLATGLPKIQTDFSKWTIFFCDERVVPVNNPDSTFGLYKKTLIDSGAVPLKDEQFVQIEQGVPADVAARAYENKVREHFPKANTPRFDLLLLGMGPDGHTCSLFPGHSLLEEKSKWFAPITDSPKPPPSRVTMTYPVVNNADVCVFAAAGKEKADMIKRILVDKEDLPATRVRPVSGDLYWIIDNDAGQFLNTQTSV
ncbi:unnamed protein product [Phyllotreta striolata]|uniref:6-phosphogluconolactonase n=1 Tax=Phyllotreta striolata TaxID=444603 RepID=A0A9N9XJ93_PHYSR|nr:unnamed protein product [Phyllotreta striolata]